MFLILDPESSCVHLEVTVPATTLKCLHANMQSMENEEDKLKICVQSQGHYLVANTETH